MVPGPSSRVLGTAEWIKAGPTQHLPSTARDLEKEAGQVVAALSQKPSSRPPGPEYGGRTDSHSLAQVHWQCLASFWLQQGPGARGPNDCYCNGRVLVQTRAWFTRDKYIKQKNLPTNLEINK